MPPPPPAAPAAPPAEPAPASAASAASSSDPAASVAEAAPAEKKEGEDGDDDDWENLDESALKIKEPEPDKKLPPGISLRPGGGGLGTFSSATKAAPGVGANGKKTYPKEFLLQFADVYTDKPDGMPDMEILTIGADGIAFKGPVGGGGRGGGAPAAGGAEEWRTAPGRGGARGGKGVESGRGRPDSNFLDPRDPRNNQFAKGQGGKPMKGGGKGGASKPMWGLEVKPIEDS